MCWVQGGRGARHRGWVGKAHADPTHCYSRSPLHWEIGQKKRRRGKLACLKGLIPKSSGIGDLSFWNSCGGTVPGQTQPLKRNEPSGEEDVWIPGGCSWLQKHHHTENLNQASHGPGTAPVLSED